MAAPRSRYPASDDAHPDLPRPRPRPPARPVDSLGRCSVYDLRRVSGLHLRERIERQTERDALVHRLAEIDDRLAELSDERRAIVDELALLREELYPPVPWAKGRRPPDVDRSPLPPAAEGSQPISGRDLRTTCLTILRRHGALALTELHGLVHRYGYVIGATRPVTALSDAMAYEVERGRARRVARGVYAATTEHPRRRPRRRRVPPLPDHPATGWQATAPVPLDPDLDEDPTTWSTHPHRGPPDSVLTESRH